MNIVAAVLAVILASACVGTAVGDFRGEPRILETMARLGVPAGKERLLGAIKLFAAAGLAVGFVVRGLHVVTGAALFLYFAIAVTAHVRVRDGFRRYAPAFVLTVVSVAFTLAALAA